MTDFSSGTRWVHWRWPLTSSPPGLELLGEILDGLRLARGRRTAAFEAVVRQSAHMLAELRLIELSLLGGRRRRQGKGDRGRGNPTHCLHFVSPQS
jgi:hypothetical protein